MAVVFVFQQTFKDMNEEDQHTKIPSPHRTSSLNPPYPSINYVTPAAGPFLPYGHHFKLGR